MSTFTELLESNAIIKAIYDMGYETPTPIQVQSIPLLKAGCDMVAKSNTGTGKTAAFGLPILEAIEKQNNFMALILCPTRELAMQASEELMKFSKHMNDVRIACVYGGAPITNQIKSLKKKPQIIVGTPGRVLDHMRRKSLKLNNCDCVVLDEADEMLNMGFREDIETVLNAVEEKHQTVLFSATMPKEIRDLAARYLHEPQEIHVQSKQQTVDKITQHYYDVKQSEKNHTVKLLLASYNPSLSIIFCNTKARVDDLVESLKKEGVVSMGLHGDIRQEKRTKIMQSFKKAKRAVLVASDVAARGIDVNNIDLVLNYDLPQENETYIHRIGRTGRAGKEGLAVTLIQSYKQKQQLKQIMRFTKANIEKQEVPSDEDIKLIKKEQFKQQIMDANQAGIKDEHLQFANELIKDGMLTEEIISALISVAFGGTLSAKPKKAKSKKTKASDIKVEEKPKKKKKKEVELKFSVGKAKNVTREEIENAILGRCNLEKKDILNVDLRKNYSIITIEEKNLDHVLEFTHKIKINNKRCEVYPYKKSKTKERKYS